MSKWKLYHNPQCSKSREALALLQSTKQPFEIVEYLKNPLSKKELLELMNEMDGPLAALIRQKEEEFKVAPFDVNSKETMATELAKKPRLMERPILRGNGKAVIGRPLENLNALLKI